MPCKQTLIASFCEYLLDVAKRSRVRVKSPDGSVAVNCNRVIADLGAVEVMLNVLEKSKIDDSDKQLVRNCLSGVAETVEDRRLKNKAETISDRIL